MKAKTKPTPLARRMWANYHPHCPAPDTFDSKARAISWAKSYSTMVETVPVAVIPLHDPEALVAKATDAHYAALQLAKGRITNGDCMAAALTAIGVLPRKGGRK